MSALFLLVALVALIGIIKPLPRLYLPTRGRAVMLFGVSLFAVALVAPEREKAEPTTQTAAVEATTPDPPPSLEPPDMLRKIVADQFGDKMKSVETRRLAVDVRGNYPEDESQLAWGVDVQFRAADNFTTNMTKKGIERDMMESFQALFTSAVPVGMVSIEAYMMLIDKFGNEEEGIVYGATMRSQVASQVNWENWEILDPKDVWDIYFTNVAFRESP